MWWGDRPPAGCNIVMKSYPDREPHYYPGWKQCRYLPLAFGTDYATGLTVYMDSEFKSVIGVVSHGPSDVVLGKAMYFDDKQQEARHSPGIPFYFAFNPGEHLSSVWLHQTHSGLNGVLAVGLFTLHPRQIFKSNLTVLRL